MTSHEMFVVVGAGHAGGRAVSAMRKEGFQGRIVLIGEEPYLPYERPPLSKEVLSDDIDPLNSIIHDEEYYREHDIDLMLGKKVIELNLSDHSVALEDGETIEYSKLLLTTGSRARKLRMPGSQLSGVVVLRTIDDAVILRKLLRPNMKVVLIGGGFIGLEVAASACKLGCQVTVLEVESRLLARAVPDPISEYISGLHESHGVKVQLGVGATKITGDGEVAGVISDDGLEHLADVVVIGIGAVPNTELAQAAGINCDNGIVVDEYCRTSSPDVYAAGDVTNHFNAMLKKHIRLETWDNAEKQSVIAAASMCGSMSGYGVIPWFWSDQYTTNLQLLGYQSEGDQTVIRGRPEDSKFCVFTLASGKIVGAALVNSGGDRRPVLNMMETGREIDPAVLKDPAVNLRTLMRR